MKKPREATIKVKTKSNPSAFRKDFGREYTANLAKHHPKILVSALRSAGWEVTARKTIVTEL